VFLHVPVAGVRALQVVPCCYSLLESCLEVLVGQVTLMEELADLDAPEPEPPEHKLPQGTRTDFT
jgi:hypothetical protein